MALLALTIQSNDIALWGTFELIKQNLSASAIKRLKIALDPLIDPSVNNPETAYSLE